MASAITIISPPSAHPVNVAELKDHIRLLGDDGSQDYLLNQLIGGATAMFERETSRALVQRTLRYHLDRFPHGVVYLPKPPAIEVLNIKYIDQAGSQQTLDPDRYIADVAHVPARIQAVGHWPAVKAMFEITLTSVPAYSETSVSQRSIDPAAIAAAEAGETAETPRLTEARMKLMRQKIQLLNGMVATFSEL